MPYDPNIPANNSPLSSAVMRGQLQSIVALISAIQNINAAQVDGVTTLNPGDPASALASVIANTLHFTFGIPSGPQGPAGIDGAPGEVTNAQLNAAIATAISGTSNNTNAAGTMDAAFYNEPAFMADMELMRAKYNELVLALRKP